MHQIDVLKRQGFAVIAPDLPGHGQSENARTPESTYSFPGYAAVVSRLVDALELASVDVVGWSLGGHIGLQLLATDARIRSLLIVGTPPARPSAEALEKAFNASATMRLAGKKDFSEADVRSYAAGMLGDEGDPAPHLMSCVRRTDGNARHFMFANAMRGIGVDQRRAVETIDKPLCISHGELEPFVRLEYLRSIKYRCLWANRIFVVSNAGHAPHWQYPHEFNDILLSFLESLNPTDKRLKDVCGV